MSAGIAGPAGKLGGGGTSPTTALVAVLQENNTSVLCGVTVSSGEMSSWDLESRPVGGAWSTVASTIVDPSYLVSGLTTPGDMEFRAIVRLVSEATAAASATIPVIPNPPPVMTKMVMTSMGDGWIGKTATTRAAGSYLFLIRNPLYGITTCTSATFYLRNTTATPIPVGRVWSTQSGGYSANINLQSKRNVGTDPATSMVATQFTDMAGNPVTEIPAGTVNVPGIVKAVVNHGPGGTGGSGAIVFRFECNYAGARMERSVALSKGHLQIQSSHAATLDAPTSTETTDWATGASAGSLISEVHFHTTEDVCNIAVVGDSHVACYITGDECNSWTHSATDRFRAAGQRINLINYGRSGSTSPDWTARIRDRVERLGFRYTALLTKTWTVNESGNYTLAQRDADIAEIAPLIAWAQSQGIAPLFMDVVLPPANYDTAQEVQYLRDTHAACGSRIYLDAYRSLLVDPDAAIPLTVSGFLRPDNLHLSCVASTFGALDLRPDPQVYGVDRYAVAMASSFPAFLDAQGVPR